jgi:hypothetical protein
LLVVDTFVIIPLHASGLIVAQGYVFAIAVERPRRSGFGLATLHECLGYMTPFPSPFGKDQVVDHFILRISSSVEPEPDRQTKKFRGEKL